MPPAPKHFLLQSVPFASDWGPKGTLLQSVPFVSDWGPKGTLSGVSLLSPFGVGVVAGLRMDSFAPCALSPSLSALHVCPCERKGCGPC